MRGSLWEWQLSNNSVLNASLSYVCVGKPLPFTAALLVLETKIELSHLSGK
jgi:hypothetical protein